MPENKEFLLNSFEAARQEIIERMKFREQMILAYLTGSITFLGIALTYAKPSNVQALCMVMPFISMIIAMRLSDNQNKIDKVAQFIRGPLNAELKRLNMWAPHWDWHTHAEKDARGKPLESQKYFTLAISNFASIHLPTLASIFISYIFYDNRKEYADLYFILTIIFFLVAFLYNTFEAFVSRETSISEHSNSP